MRNASQMRDKEHQLVGGVTQEYRSWAARNQPRVEGLLAQPSLHHTKHWLQLLWGRAGHLQP